MIRLVSLTLSFLLSASAQAGKMDIETHTLVINKLERVLSDSGKSPKQNLSLILRVADLYAERARLKSIAEVEKNCTGCLGSKKDRKSAIAQYKKITPHLEGEVGATVLMQTAHLHQLVQETKKAKNLYKEVIRQRKRRSSKVVAQAYTGLANLYFLENKYKKSLKNYNLALSEKSAPKKGFLIYRKAWCLLNIGKTKSAVRELTTLLESPRYLDVSDGADLLANASFQEDVSRDFASFLVRTSLNSKKIQLLQDLSPDKVKKQNLFYLGTEAERVGQKKSALLVWDVYTQRADIPFEEKLEIQTRKAKIRLDLGQKSLALKEYKVALKLWASGSCKDSVDCEGIRQKLRSLPVTWNQLEKKTPTRRNHQAYRAYTQVFNSDFEMHYWAAQLARNLNLFKQSVHDYRRASQAAKSQLKKGSKEAQKSSRKIFEGSLLAEVEMAEADKSWHLREAAYKHYLKENPKGQKAETIRYQLAHLDYEAKKYQRAAFQFKLLVEDKSLSKKTKTMSSDLALDSLAILKDHKRIEKWALEFSTVLPKRSKEYKQISRKATVNLAATVINNKKATSSQLLSAHKSLKGFSVFELEKKEQENYWKTRLLAAEKVKDLADIKYSARKYLKQPKLGSQSKNWAQSLIVFSHEMLFEFNAAYKMAIKTDFPRMNETNTLLKLAVLAELAEKKSASTKYYRQFIKKTPSVRKANTIRLKLISQTRNPWNLLNEFTPKLRRTPDLLAPAALETFARFPNFGRAEKLIKSNRSLLKFPEGRSLNRFVFLKDYWKFDKSIRNHRIKQGSNSVLQKTLKKRLDLIAESEKWVKKAGNLKDWTLQVITLDRLQKEYSRLHTQVLGFRTPRGLNKKQRREYKVLLTQQAKPFQQKSLKIGNKTQEFWKNEQAFNSLKRDYKKANGPTKKIIRDEIMTLKSRSPKFVQRKISRLIKEEEYRNLNQKIKVAYNRVKKSPFSNRDLKQLIALETQRNNDSTLLGYLTERQKVIRQGVL